MLVTNAKLSSYALAAGEPFLLGVQVREQANMAVVNMAARPLTLSFYSAATRDTVASIEGVWTTDASGGFYRFARDGQFSDNLYGQTLVAELSERLKLGRNVLAIGSVAIASSADGLPSYTPGVVGRTEARVTIYVDTTGVAQLWEHALLAYSGGAPANPPPTFTTPASIASDGTPQVGEQLTGVDGAVVDGSVTSRRWLLGTTTLATVANYTPTATGSHRFEATATGPGGTTTSSSTVSVAAANNPAPSFTTNPSISPTSGNVGATFTGSDGVVANGTVQSRRWLLTGVQISTGATATPVTAGSLVLQVTASGPGGTVTGSSAAVTVTGSTASPTPPGDRTASMTSRATLPDGAHPVEASVGYPCTSLALDRSDNTYWGGHGTGSASSNAGMVHLSATFAVLGQFTVGSLGLPAGSVQGSDVDSSDDTLWFLLKITSNGTYLVHTTKTGVLIGSTLMSNATNNGLAYDSARDCLILMRDDGSVQWVNKPSTAGGSVTSTGKTGFTAAGTANDQLHYDPLRDELLVSGGTNNVAGTVDVYDVSATTAPTRITTITFDQALAIEGIVRKGDDVILVSDQHTHLTSIPAVNQNQRQTYVNGMLPVPVFAFAAPSTVEEGSANTFTLNVIRNGLTGALTGTWAASAGPSSPANASDFGGTFPNGSWTIASGANSTTITVTPSEDVSQEGNEQYRITATRNSADVATVVGVIGEDDASGSYSTEATALFARMTSQPSNSRKTAIDNLIVALKNGGVWAKCDGIWVPASHDEQAACLNWKVDANTAILSSTAPTFTSDRGFTTNGTTSYVDYNLAVDGGGQYAQNSATLALWCNTAGMQADGTAALAASLGTGQVGLNPRASSGVIASRVNSTSATTGANQTTGVGLAAVSRTSSTAVQHYKDGAASGGVGSATSSALPGGRFNSGRGRGSSTFNYTAVGVAATVIGSAFTAAEHAALFNGLASYMASVGNV